MTIPEITMTQAIILSLLSVIIISAVPLLAFSFMKIGNEKLRKITGVFVALAIGAMLGDVVFHIYPEATETNTTSFWIFALAGVVFFFIAERLIHWHHHQNHDHTHPIGKLVLLGDGVHNFVDGLLIAGSFLISPSVGFATAVAVILHEIPQELGDFSVLLHAGYTKTRAVRANFLSACAAIIGCLVGILGNNLVQGLPVILLSVTAGGFVYVSLTDLLPWVLKKKGSLPLSFVMFFIGLLAMYILTFVE